MIKNNLHTPITIMIVSILTIHPIAIARQNAAQTQAEADAIRQIEATAIRDATTDTTWGYWLTYGVVGCCLGTILGGVVGYSTGSIINSEWEDSGGIYSFYGPNDAQVIGCILGALIVGSIGPTITAYNHTPTPPADRLLGKSPEYIETYTKVYQKTARIQQALKATAGSLGIPAAIIVIVIVI